MSSWKQLNTLSEVLADLQKVPEEVAHELEIQMFMEGEEIITNSKGRTPVDTGALRASEIAETRRTGSRIQTTVSAGGPSAPYAVIVHEDLQARHTTGEAKFLEHAVQDQVNSGMEQRLADAILRGFKKAGL